MIAVVTGATGAMGSYLCEALCREAWEVRGVRGRGVSKEFRVKNVCYDDLRALPDVVSGADVVFNLAGAANVRASFELPVTFIENNLAATVNLLEAIRLFAPKARLVHCSTSEVYGRASRAQYPNGIPETASRQPVSPYAASKVAQEAVVQSYAQSFGLDVVTTRAFGYVNPRREDLVLTSFARQIVDLERDGQTLIRHGNLDSVRTFCDARDVADAYIVAARARPGVYNLGSVEPRSIREALLALLRVSKTTSGTVTLELDPALMRSADVTDQVPNVDRFFGETGWRPRINFEESLEWLLSEVRNER